MLIAPMWAKSPRLMEIVLLPCSQPWPFLLHRERRDFIISSLAGTPRLTSLAHDRFNLNAVRLVHVIDTIQSAGALTTKSICRWCGKLFQHYLAASSGNVGWERVNDTDSVLILHLSTNLRYFYVHFMQLCISTLLYLRGKYCAVYSLLLLYLCLSDNYSYSSDYTLFNDFKCFW